MNEKETGIALEAINYLKEHGLSIGQGWQVNGEPPRDVRTYLDGMIETCFPTDEHELAEQVIELIEDELQGG
jgi:hypothetical protein